MSVNTASDKNKFTPMVEKPDNLLLVNAATGIDKDSFFDEVADGVIRVFAFDYEAVAEFTTLVTQRNSLIAFIIPYLWPAAPCFIYFLLNLVPLNVKDRVYAQHVCLTRDGIKYVVDHHLKDCRCECQRQGRVSKTIPYDKITDCDVDEPAGSSGPVCCLVPNVLHVVNIDTASSGGGSHELQLVGLRDPHAFKRAVWAMKRGEVDIARTGTLGKVTGKELDQSYGKKGDYGSISAGKGYQGSAGYASSSSKDISSSETVPLLKKQNELLTNIRDALEENNKLLRKAHNM